MEQKTITKFELPSNHDSVDTTEVQPKSRVSKNNEVWNLRTMVTGEFKIPSPVTTGSLVVSTKLI